MKALGGLWLYFSLQAKTPQLYGQTVPPCGTCKVGRTELHCDRNPWQLKVGKAETGNKQRSSSEPHCKEPHSWKKAIYKIRM